jgi:hypothetical protein
MGNNPKEKDVYEAVDHCDQREASGSIEHISYNKTYKECVENSIMFPTLNALVEQALVTIMLLDF